MQTRSVDVPLSRLAAWTDGFTRRNGAIVRVQAIGDAALLVTERGGTARIDHAGRFVEDVDSVVGLAGLVAHLVAGLVEPRSVAAVLVRRGGYAVGDLSVGVESVLHCSRNGSRYVQGRTAAGGQSQQRFARRRANQADALVGAATAAAVEVLGIRPRALDVLVTGGDAALLAQVLADPRLDWLSHIEDRRAVEVPDPRQRTLVEAATRALAVRIEVTNAEEPTSADGQKSTEANVPASRKPTRR